MRLPPQKKSINQNNAKMLYLQNPVLIQACSLPAPALRMTQGNLLNVSTP